MNATFEHHLLECLEALEAGEQLEDVLARYPNQAEQLQAVLLMAQQIPNMALRPSPAAQARSKQAFLAEAEKMQKPVTFASHLTLRFSALQMAASLFLIFGLFAVLLVSALSNAEPGDMMYGARTRLDALLRSEPVQQVDKIKELLRAGQSAKINFDGTVQNMEPDIWTISGLPIVVTGETVIINGPIVIGMNVTVEGYIETGQLTATVITAEDKPTPTLTETSIPTETPSPTLTPYVPTPTPTLEPTAAPTSDDDEHDDDEHDDEEETEEP